jgi:RND family efflux transporter MFP subunit
LYFKADIPEKAIAEVAQGRRVRIQVDALQGATIDGVVADIYPSGSTTSRNFSVRVAIPHGDRARPGMFARGEIVIGEHHGCLLVPKESVDEQGGTQSVYVVGTDGVARKLVVSVSRTDSRHAQIETPTSLKVGDRVVTQGLKNIQDGTKVEVGKGRSGDVAH